MNSENLTLLENEPLSRYASLRIGGPARLLLFPKNEAGFREALRLCGGERPVVMGNGTNLLFPDEGLTRPVINTVKMSGEPEPAGENELLAPCGLALSRLALRALNMGLSGLEFAHGIPGTLGGAVFMNAGAYGGEMKDVVLETRCVDLNGESVILRGEEHGFVYRGSALTGGGLYAMKSRLRLVPGDFSEIKTKMEELAIKRRASQPLEYPSAGSAFKRPKTGYAAAMIDAAGLKGLRVGGACVSEKHAGFIINLGGASARDVTELIRQVRERVFERTGILLEPEIRVVG